VTDFGKKYRPTVLTKPLESRVAAMHTSEVKFVSNKPYTVYDGKPTYLVLEANRH